MSTNKDFTELASKVIGFSPESGDTPAMQQAYPDIIARRYAELMDMAETLAITLNRLGNTEKRVRFMNAVKQLGEDLGDESALMIDELTFTWHEIAEAMQQLAREYGQPLGSLLAETLLLQRGLSLEKAQELTDSFLPAEHGIGGE